MTETIELTENEKKMNFLRQRRNLLLTASEMDGRGRDDRPFSTEEKAWRAVLRDLPKTLDLDDIGGTFATGYNYNFPEYPSSLADLIENSGYSNYCKIVEEDGWTHLPSVSRSIANGGIKE